MVTRAAATIEALHHVPGLIAFTSEDAQAIVNSRQRLRLASPTEGTVEPPGGTSRPAPFEGVRLVA